MWENDAATAFDTFLKPIVECSSNEHNTYSLLRLIFLHLLTNHCYVDCSSVIRMDRDLKGIRVVNPQKKQDICAHIRLNYVCAHIRNKRQGLA